MRPMRRGGFTLLEMMAVVVLMAIVLGVAIDFYLDLSHATQAATNQTRGARRAMVLLDRVARDLEGTVLLQKPPDVDPQAWNWLFLAEADGPDAGAERVKFVRRGHAPRSSDLPESDLEMIAWMVGAGPDGDIELRRASWLQLPEGLDRSFPSFADSDLVTGGLASFGIRFQGETGDWTGRWDSSQVAESSALPLAAEIEVSFATGEEGVVDGPYSRKVLLPLRPLDLAKKLAQAAGEEVAEDEEPKDEDGDGDIDKEDQAIAEQRAENAAGGDAGSTVTLEECMQRSPGVVAAIEAATAGNPQAIDLVNSMKSLPVAQAAQFAGMAVPPECR